MKTSTNHQSEIQALRSSIRSPEQLLEWELSEAVEALTAANLRKLCTELEHTSAKERLKTSGYLKFQLSEYYESANESYPVSSDAVLQQVQGNLAYCLEQQGYYVLGTLLVARHRCTLLRIYAKSPHWLTRFQLFIDGWRRCMPHNLPSCILPVSSTES
jgi:hypothetical protein